MLDNKYTAFISYRHTMPDEAVAKKLHTLIETYSIPSKLKRSSGKKRMGRVFRDQEELPLSTDLGADIRTALENSEWLIVLCSPRYLESMWCKAELDYFISLGKRDHILAILVDGDPDKVFPKQLCYAMVNGVMTPVEPLAGDVRGNSVNESLKKLKQEKLRVLAPMLGVSFDTLRQRARRRKTRLITAAAIAGFAVLAGFLTYALLKNAQIAEQRDLAMDNQMQVLIEQANTSTKNGNKLTALSTLNKAISLRDTVGDSKDEALGTALEYALYNDIFGTIQTINNDNRKFSKLIFSHNDKYILGVNSGYSATLIDSGTGEMLYSVSRSIDSEVDDIGFTKDDKYFYTVDAYRNNVSMYQVSTGELYRQYDLGSDENWLIYEEVYPLSDGRLIITKEKSIDIWDYEADKHNEILPASDYAGDIYTRVKLVDLSPDETMLAFGSPGYGYGMRIVKLSDLSETPMERGTEGYGVTFDINNAKGTKPDNKLSGYMNIRFSGNSKYICGTSGQMYYVWDSATGNLLFEQYLDTEYGTNPNAMLSEDGATLFIMTTNLFSALDYSNLEVIWDKKTEDSNIVTEAVISPNGKYVSTAGGITGIFDVKSGELLSERNATAFSHDGTRLIADPYKNNPAIMVTPDASTSKHVDSFDEELYAADRYTKTDKNVSLTLTHQAAEFYTTYPGNVERVARIFNSTDKRYCVQTHNDGFMEVFDISDPEDPKEIYCLADHCFNNVTDVTFNGDLMASCGGYDPRCVVFDLKAGKILHILPAEEFVQSCEFSKDGSKIIMIAGYQRDKALVYSTSTGNLLYSFNAPDGKTFEKAGFNMDGTLAAAVMGDGSAITGQLFPSLDDLITQAKNGRPGKTTFDSSKVFW